MTNIEAFKRQAVIQPTDLSLLKINGEDARDFLSAILANDVRLISTEQFQSGCWCDPKGRVLVNFRLFLWQDSYYMLFARDLAATIQKRLQMFVLRSRVSVSDVSEELKLQVFIGHHIDELLQNKDIPLPAVPGQQLADTKQLILSLPGVVPCYLRIASSSLEIPAIESAENSLFRLFEIASGHAHITANNSGNYIPQMLNLDLLGAVSFTKGCYPGQEIVTRLKHRGGLKKRCYLFRAETVNDITQGHTLLDARQEKIGEVVNLQVESPSTVLLLAVIQISSAGDECHLEGQSGALTRLDTPYPIPDE